MKRQRFLLIFGFICAFAGLFLWPFVKENYYARSIAKMPSAEVEAQTLALNRLTIPPDGTPLRDVENVYGKLKVAEIEADKSSKGIPDFSSRELLPRLFGTEARAILLARVENGATFQNGINHLCVAKNRKQIGLGPNYSPQQLQELRQLQREYKREEQGVLLDLMLIRDQYGRALNNASWNR